MPLMRNPNCVAAFDSALHTRKVRKARSSTKSTICPTPPALIQRVALSRKTLCVACEPRENYLCQIASLCFRLQLGLSLHQLHELHASLRFRLQLGLSHHQLDELHASFRFRLQLCKRSLSKSDGSRNHMMRCRHELPRCSLQHHCQAWLIAGCCVCPSRLLFPDL